MVPLDARPGPTEDDRERDRERRAAAAASQAAPPRPRPPPVPAAGAPGPAPGPGAAPRRRCAPLALALVVVGLLVVAAASVQTFLGADQALARAGRQREPSWSGSRTIQTVPGPGRRRRDQRASWSGGSSRSRSATATPRRSTPRFSRWPPRPRPSPPTARCSPTSRRRSRTTPATVELARANNRQALPVGAQYLKNASAGLRADALPALAALIAANEQAGRRRARQRPQTGRCWSPRPRLVGLLVLIAAMVWLARRTHRYLNAPCWSPRRPCWRSTSLWPGGDGEPLLDGRTAQRGPYAAARALAEARIAAFDAKANESLTLIARGLGGRVRGRLAGRGATTAVARLGGRGRRGRGGGPGSRRLGAYAERHAADPRGRRRRRLGRRRRAGDRARRRAPPTPTSRRSTSALGRPCSTQAGRRHVRRLGRRARGPPCRSRSPGPWWGSSSPRCPGAGWPAGSRSTDEAPRIAARAARSSPRPRLSTACTAGAYADTVGADAGRPAASSSAPASSAATTPAQCADPLASYAPTAALPAPDALPAGSTMAAIRARGRLIVGVSADSLLLGSRNPITGQDRGLRHRHGAARGPGDPRRPGQGRAAGDHRRAAHPGC